MSIRQQFFQTSDRRRFIAASALDTDRSDRVKTSNAPYLFVAEGVLVYLSEAQVKQLLANLVQHFPGALFVFDSMSALMAKNQKRHDILKNRQAQFDWHISDIHNSREWDDRYQVLEMVRFKNLADRYSK